MQTELVSRGPLSVLMNAELLQFYHSGVWDPIFGCDPTQTDHGRWTFTEHFVQQYVILYARTTRNISISLLL